MSTGLDESLDTVLGKQRKAERLTRRAQDDQKFAIAKAQKTEAARLAEATSAVATSEAAAKSGKAGRKSLLKTSPGGMALNLGGTNA